MHQESKNRNLCRNNKGKREETSEVFKDFRSLKGFSTPRIIFYLTS
jgi:hypothetical protein